MLPTGFHWESYMDGPALYLGEDRVADVTPLVNGSFRVCFHPHTPTQLRYEFFDSERAAEIYIEQWACKWEARIRRGG